MTSSNGTQQCAFSAFCSSEDAKAPQKKVRGLRSPALSVALWSPRSPDYRILEWCTHKIYLLHSVALIAPQAHPLFSELLGSVSHSLCLTSLALSFLQHKVLLQQFNTGDERAQKRQPIRGSDEGERCLVWNFYSQANICPWISSPWNHHYHKKRKKKALLLALGSWMCPLGLLISYVLGVWYPDRTEMLAHAWLALPLHSCHHLLKECGFLQDLVVKIVTSEKNWWEGCRNLMGSQSKV